MKRSTTSPNHILTAEAQHTGYGQQRKGLGDRCITYTLQTVAGMVITLGIVADGVSTSSTGEAATQLVIDTVLQYIQTTEEQDVQDILEHALHAAHDAILQAAGVHVALRATGSTATLAAIHENRLYLAHIGNSRAYLVRGEKIQQLTLDHTWDNEKVRGGQFDMEDAFAYSPGTAKRSAANELARYIGQAVQTIDIDLGVRLDDLHPATSTLRPGGLPLQKGDVVLLCTDGLVKQKRTGDGHYTEPDEITSIVQRNSAQDAANALISLALSRQVDDNVSVVILKMPGKPQKVNPAVILTSLAAVVGVLLIAGVVFLFGFPFQPVGVKKAVTPTVTVPSGNVLAILDEGSRAQYQPPSQPVRDLRPGLVPVQPGTMVSVIEGRVRLGLPDDSILYIGGNTFFTFDQIANPTTGNDETVLSMQQGGLLIRIPPGINHTASVRLSNNYRLQVTGSVMGVEYALPNFSLDCFEGHCNILDASRKNVSQLTAGQFVFASGGVIKPMLYGSGNNPRVQFWIGAIGEANFATLGLPFAMGTPTPTWTLTPLPTLTLTPNYEATQQCDVLRRRGTPCPPQR